MALYSLAGTKVSIGTSLAVDFSGSDSDILEDFAADAYVEIAETETISDFGDTATDVPFTALADARTRHLKGSTDGGVATITCGDMPSDPGQVAVKAAADPTDQAEYNFKFEWKNGDVSYIRGPVMSFTRINGSGPNNVARRSFGVSNSYGEFIDLATGGGVAPNNTVLPAITGTAETDETLTASSGSWTGTPGPTYTYQWFLDGESLPGKTASTIVIIADYEGSVLTVMVTATNTAGTAYAMSAATATITAGA